MKNGSLNDSPIRIPVKLVDGDWKYFYGGGLLIEDGAIGSLIVDKHSILDQELLKSLKRRSTHKILDEGTELLVALTIKPGSGLDETLLKQLTHAHEHRIFLSGNKNLSASTQFVRVRIGGPTESQKKKDPNENGGIWLILEGTEPKGLTTSKLMLPTDDFSELADSLNHAFTLLSEKFEPWRKSHTGNIYERFFYKESSGQWYPLDTLRNAAIADEERQRRRA